MSISEKIEASVYIYIGTNKASKGVPTLLRQNCFTVDFVTAVRGAKKL